MSDLIASSLSVHFGTTALFDDVSLTIDRGDRIALVGPNGAGKTTLLRVLAGRLSPTTGEVRVPSHLRLALHDQRPERSRVSLRDYVSPPHMVAFEARLRELEQAMAGGDEAVMREYTEVRTQYDVHGGEAWPARVDEVLRGLGFTQAQHDQALDTLSGGELTRASLARSLSGDPDVLLLDEPTNHLDIEAIDWLQDYLQAMPGGVVLVSHDRWFIEAVCTSVVEIAAGRARRFNGSFVEYRAQQALEAVTHQRHIEKWQEEVARLQRFVDKFSAGTRSRQAQSRVKMLDKLRQDAPQYQNLSERRGLSFKLPTPPRSGAVVFDIRGIELGFPGSGDGNDDPRGGRTLLPATDLSIERGEKVALLGRNGSGKSTLLQALAAATIPLVKQPEGYRDGDVRVGYGVEARLLSQHDSELRDELSMIGNMRVFAPNVTTTDARSLLGLFGFSGDEGERLVRDLSGGERRRLLLASALTGAANVLLLDEPTNHLDIEGREALEAALAEYDGTVLLISHDRALVEGVASRTIVLHDQMLTTAIGGYTHAREVIAGEATVAAAPRGVPSTDGSAAAQQGMRAATPAKQATSPKGARTGDAGARTVRRPADAGPSAGSGGARNGGGDGAGSPRRSRRDKAPGPKVRRPNTIEREIAQLEADDAAVQATMLDPEVYTSPEKSAAALDEHGRLQRELTRRYEELERSLEHHGA